MTLRERLGKLDRAQNSRLFKIIASCVVIALHVGLGVTLAVVAGKAQHDRVVATGGPAPEAKAPDAKDRAAGPGAAAQPAVPIQEAAEIFNSIISARSSIDTTGLALAGSLVFWLAIVWLGLTLTYLALALGGAIVCVPLILNPGTRGAGQLLAGVTLLSAAFTVLLRGAEMLVSPRGPVFAVARNVLSEAVRMKVSLVFIVLLILGLAALPGWVDSGGDPTPLRYRVQVFLQYGTGGAYWMIALLTLAFSASTVSFEQRDKTIWQTMTKPVSPWQYVLGKWLGVVVLNAVLLAVCGAAVFQFTEFLRAQPAQGEREAYDFSSGQLSEDRVILETQVLTARVAVQADPPELDPENFKKGFESRLEEERKSNASFQPTRAVLEKMAKDLRDSVELSYRSLGPMEDRLYVFSGLSEARDRKLPLTFRYRVNSGSNAPDQIYRITMAFSGESPTVQECGLGYFHSLQLFPGVVDSEGRATLQVMNGDLYAGQPNPNSISFPPGGLEISYIAGSYRANFFRVMLVLWVKLAFLAMVSIWASTFLSFPVACLVAFGTFFCAESASFLAEALENYQSVDDKDNVIWYAVIIRAIAVSVSSVFKVYSDLRPTTRLVEGSLLPWASVAGGVGAIAGATLALFGAASFTLRRRELAVYSGQ